MKHNDWKALKRISEKEFENYKVDNKNTWGFQVQKNTKWNKGLREDEIKELEKRFGFEFPIDYFEMLKNINGFDTLHISIDPDGIEKNEFQRVCYKYPDDLENSQWVIDDAKLNIEFAIEALRQNGFDNFVIEGFIPLYSHRAIVVYKDKSKSIVLSIWGNDIIVFGNSLFEYWCNEFYL